MSVITQSIICGLLAGIFTSLIQPNMEVAKLRINLLNK